MFIQKMKQEMHKKPTYMTTEAQILITMGEKGRGTILWLLDVVSLIKRSVTFNC